MTNLLFGRTRWFRTEVRYMRKGELFRSSGEFLVAGLVGVGLCALAFFFMFVKSSALPNAWSMGAFFVLEISTLMVLLGALYLLLRACLRSSTYDPQKVWEVDQARMIRT